MKSGIYKMTVVVRPVAAALACLIHVSAGGAQVPTTLPVPVYNGTMAKPNFTGSGKKYAYFKTRLNEGFRQGVNFAGHYRIIQIGCGAGCTSVQVGDLKTGHIMDFPLGGEGNYMLDLKFTPTSRLVSAHWYEDGAMEKCLATIYALEGSSFRQITTQTEAVGHCPDR